MGAQRQPAGSNGGCAVSWIDQFRTVLATWSCNRIAPRHDCCGDWMCHSDRLCCGGRIMAVAGSVAAAGLRQGRFCCRVQGEPARSAVKTKGLQEHCCYYHLPAYRYFTCPQCAGAPLADEKLQVDIVPWATRWRNAQRCKLVALRGLHRQWLEGDHPTVV